MKFINNAFTESLMSLLADDKHEKVATFEDAMVLASNLNREIFLYDGITEDIGTAANTYIRFWNKVDDENHIAPEEREPIMIYIDTNGGSVTAALTIIDSIKLSKTPIYTINVGCAYSAGFEIFISGHKRISYPNATFLFHEGSIGGIDCDAHKFRNYADFYQTLLVKCKQHILDNTKITEEVYAKYQKDDWWLTAEEAKSYGICDEIAGEL